ncbi:unnamed protein product [Chironomus riparius]|uniref:BPTI/Kunitz inhibitor domain-containing protein n=1 Tax=Chironomus riparius TaxID=315576 RepID=A0A9N9S470_9DIPT|nr:unnamed protein product [Chironomus riparius]
MKFVLTFGLVVGVFAAFVSGGGQSVSSQVDKCLAPFTPGSYSVSLPRFYFNVETRTCDPFTYKGGYITNIFKFYDNCVAACSKHFYQ